MRMDGQEKNKTYDVIVIGAGVCGCATARELSRYHARIAVLEKEEDVCAGTSKANSGIVHAGYDAMPGSLKAKLNVEGNKMMEELSEILDFPFERRGSLVVCVEEQEMPNLKALYERGIENGVEGLQILGRDEVLAMEPHVSEHVVAALYAPTAGIVCPFGMNIAFAENAYANGVDFYLDTEVTGIVKEENGFRIQTGQGEFFARCVINAAGVYADVIHNMVSKRKLKITPRRGEYYLLDKSAGAHVGRTMFQLPGKLGKGVLVTPTVHGNLLVGPNAVDIEEREGVNTTQNGLDHVWEKSGLHIKELPLHQVITSFAGLRAHEMGSEFIIGETEDVDGFFDCAGIESPGLTSAPAIGAMLAELLREKLKLEENTNFIAERKGILNPQKLSEEERAEWIRKHPEYGNIICRCEMVSEGEIMDAIHRPLGARSLDGVKRRTRAGMGRCQSGFCMPKTMEILSRELGIKMTEVTKCGGNSFVVTGKNKETL